jgi:hypothetical protein
MDADNIMTLHESFYLLEPLKERWGKGGLWNFGSACVPTSSPPVSAARLLAQHYVGI